jgi:hypothetical protein
VKDVGVGTAHEALLNWPQYSSASMIVIQRKRSAVARLATSAEHGACPLANRISIIVNWLIGPVVRVGEDIGPELGHLAVVAIFARVCEKDAAGIVLGRLWLSRSTRACVATPLVGYTCHFLLLLSQ